MFKLNKIQYGGYADATTGGVSFIIFVDVPKERFPSLEGQEIRLNIVVPISSKQDMIYTLVTRMDFEDGHFGHFGTVEELTADEIKYIKKWCADNEIVKESQRITFEYNKEMDTFFYWGDKVTKIYKEQMSGTFKNTDKKKEEWKEIEFEMSEARKRADAYEHIEYI
jgi:hypothetical protein